MKTFQRGDHVEWNSEAGRVRGIVIRRSFLTCDSKASPSRHESATPIFHQERQDRPRRNSQRCCPSTSQQTGALEESEEVSEKKKNETLRIRSDSFRFPQSLWSLFSCRRQGRCHNYGGRANVTTRLTANKVTPSARSAQRSARHSMPISPAPGRRCRLKPPERGIRSSATSISPA